MIAATSDHYNTLSHRLSQFYNRLLLVVGDLQAERSTEPYCVHFFYYCHYHPPPIFANAFSWSRWPWSPGKIKDWSHYGSNISIVNYVSFLGYFMVLLDILLTRVWNVNLNLLEWLIQCLIYSSRHRSTPSCILCIVF